MWRCFSGCFMRLNYKFGNYQLPKEIFRMQNIKSGDSESDPRNKALMKMFNLINIGERAGSGVPNIFNVWADEGWEEPVIEEKFNPDRTVLSLSFKKSSDKKAAIKSGDKKVTKKTQMQYDKILAFMEEGKEYGIWDFCELLNLKESRTKVILQGLSDHIEMVGSNRDRRYKKK